MSSPQPWSSPSRPLPAEDDGLWPGSFSSSLLPYSDYSERREDEEAEGGLQLPDDGLSAGLRQEEDDVPRREQEAGGRSERQEEAEQAEQDRLREAGSQGLFGQDDDEGEEEEQEQAVELRLPAVPEEEQPAVSSPPVNARKRKRADDATGKGEAETAVSPAAVPPPAPVSRTASGDAAALVSSPAAAATPPPPASRPQQSRSALSRPEFAVPEPPASSGPKRRPMYHNRKPEEFSLSFSLPPSYSSSSLQPPAASLANVSPLSHDYSSNAAAGFSPAPSRSTLPPPLSHSAASAAYGAQPSYAVAYSSSRPFAAASPPHPPPLHHSPSVPPLSPHASPRISWPPSSPRTDSITSVTQRVEQWQRAGRVQRMMKNVHQHSAASTASSALAAVSSSLSPLTTLPTRLPDSSNREALLRIDRYLRRRFVFTVLDSDQLVRGTVYNKTSAGLIITIRQVEGGGAPEALKGEAPVLSSASGEGKEEELRELDELEIRGECHLSEMQAALQGDGWRAAEPLDSRAVLDGYGVGDTVRALVISVDVHSEKVYLSMNNARLRHIAVPPPASSAVAQQIRLGPYRETALSPQGKPALPPPTHAAIDSLQPPSATALQMLPSSALAASSLSSASSPYSLLSSSSPLPSSLPVPYGFPSFRPPGASLASPSATAGSSPAYPSLSSSFSSFPVPRRRARPANYLRWLRAQPLFLNPAGLRILLAAYAINQYGSLCPPITIPPSSLYVPLRAEQNLQWARDTTLKGIGMAKRGAYANAHKLYAHALEIEPRYVQAFVARGAAFVLEGRWAEGERQFELALDIDPAHVHARQYLKACREKMRRDREGGAAGDAAAAARLADDKDASSVVVEEEKKESGEMEVQQAEPESQLSTTVGSSSADGGSSRRAVFVLSDDSSTDDESSRGREEEDDDEAAQHGRERRRGDRKDRKRERRAKDKKRKRDRRRDRTPPSPPARSAKDKEEKQWLQLD